MEPGRESKESTVGVREKKIEAGGDKGEDEEAEDSAGREREAPTTKDAQPPKKQRKSRKGIPLGKKPPGMPRRPLSAYNFFFSELRTKILEERRARRAASGETDSDRDLFSAMGRLVGQRWKQLSPKDKEKYKAMADQDLVRYRREMDEYNERIAKRNRQASRQSTMMQPHSGLPELSGAPRAELDSSSDRKPSARASINQRQLSGAQPNPSETAAAAAAVSMHGASFPQQIPQQPDAQQLANLLAQHNLISSAASQQLSPQILDLAALQRQHQGVAPLQLHQFDPRARTLESLQLQALLQHGAAQPQLIDQLLQRELQQHQLQQQQLQSQFPSGLAGMGLSALSQPQPNPIQEATAAAQRGEIMAALEQQRQRDQQHQLQLLRQQQQQQQQQQQSLRHSLQPQAHQEASEAASGIGGEQAARGDAADDSSDYSS